MSETTTPLRVGIYGRQSRDKTRSIDEQLAECSADAGQQGWKVIETYSDGVSASRFATKARDDWARVLDDIEAGRLDVLVLWESSRGDRDAETWLGLLRRCRKTQVMLRITSAERTYNLAVPRDWKELASDGIDSAYESEKLAIRVRRAMSANAAAGKPHGPTPFGYERIYDPQTRAFIEQRPDPATAPIVREIVRRTGNAEPIVDVCRDLNERGVPAPGGGIWHRSRVRSVAVNVAYIGKRRHEDERTGQVHVSAAIWPPLVDEAAHYAAVRVLTDPARKTTKPGRTKRLLSYLARCGACGELLHVHYRSAGASPHYHCSARGCVAARLEWLDEYVTQLVCALLSREDIYPRLAAADDAAVIAARGEAEALRTRLDAFYDAAAKGELTPAALARIEARLLPEIKAAEKRAIQSTTPPALRGLLDPVGDVRDRWEALSMAARKEVVRLLFTSIRLLPADRPGSRHDKFDMDRMDSRVDVEWRQA